jgi:hypothetical protein
MWTRSHLAILFISLLWLHVPATSLQNETVRKTAKLLKIQLSSVTCEGGATDPNRRCLFKNLIIRNSRIFFVYNKEPPMIPKIRASVDSLNEIRFPLWQPSYVSLLIARTWNVTRSPFRTALVWRLLEPSNWYHVLFDDYGAILRLRSLSYGTAIDRSSDVQLVFLNSKKMLPTFNLAFKWMFSRKPVHVRNLRRPFQVPLLAIGSQSICGHRGHCPKQMTSPSLINFRQAVLKHLEDDYHVLLAPSIDSQPQAQRENVSLTVGVIQRTRYRKFHNLGEIMSGNSLLQNVQPIYLEKTSVIQQAQLFSSFDITLMMHGGAIGNWLFLKPGSVVIDIHPFGHDHPLTDWIAEDLQALNITFISYFLQENATIWTESLIERVKIIYEDTPLETQQQIIRTRKCPSDDVKKYSLCRSAIFTFGDFDLNVREVSALMRLAVSKLGGQRRHEMGSTTRVIKFISQQ